MSLYSIKMRASKKSKHISGAERIVPLNHIENTVACLTKRALTHDLGQPDFINIKMEAVGEDELEYLEALPVSTDFAADIPSAFTTMEKLLGELNLADEAPRIIQLLQTTKPMRGAILYDIRTHKRLEPDQERGIRVSNMDAEHSTVTGSKNHFSEAVVLATKVANAPGIIAELCISDDPDYTTGYLASLPTGYVRLAPLKEKGDSHGGRIFLFDSSKADASTTIGYLENCKVLVQNLPSLPKKITNPYLRLESELADLKTKQLYRRIRTIDSAQSKYVEMNGKKILLLSSNSYLDLANDEEIKRLTIQAVQKWGTGSGGSRLTTGNMRLHEELEASLAQFKHTEAALLFNTGYMANLGIISALANKNSVIFSDEYNHASIIDGCKLSQARIVVYKHNDMQDLETKIIATDYQNGIIVSDAVFSMDGDIANLPQIVTLSQKYGLLSILDEAHSTGVIGATGQGIVEHFGHKYKPDILMGTLSKALGSEGGYACANHTIIEYLKNKARSFIFSTSQNPASLAAALQALHKLEREPERAQRLQHNVSYFLKQLYNAGVEADSATAIIPIIIGDEERTLNVAQDLLAKGLLIPAIRYPTVAPGTARLRVALMSSHTEEELTQAAKLIAQAIKKFS